MAKILMHLQMTSESNLDKLHGLIADWAKHRASPSADDLQSLLPGNDGSLRIKLPAIKLAEALEGQVCFAKSSCFASSICKC